VSNSNTLNSKFTGRNTNQDNKNLQNKLLHDDIDSYRHNKLMGIKAIENDSNYKYDLKIAIKDKSNLIRQRSSGVVNSTYLHPKEDSPNNRIVKTINALSKQ